MKPETTWKEIIRNVVMGHPDKNRIEVVLEIVEDLLSSSQTLARREGIEEAMRVVNEASYYSGSREEIHAWIMKALQEKLDTKGV